MHHAAKLALASLVLALSSSACSSSHETLSTTTGVYELTIAGERDACSPTRTTGPAGTAGVISVGALLTLAVPDLTSHGPMLLALDSGTGYADERTEALAPCAGATLTRSYSVVSGNASGLDVAYHESWSGLSTCGAAMRSIMPAAPTADCSADLVLHYHLATSCEAPCQIRVSADGATACHC